jgi:hypothetical protein
MQLCCNDASPRQRACCSDAAAAYDVALHTALESAPYVSFVFGKSSAIQVGWILDTLCEAFFLSVEQRDDDFSWFSMAFESLLRPCCGSSIPANQIPESNQISVS